ncbi:alpha-L-fucosidase [Prevotella copri]|uniref:alpha-L-fucosidase n=1 Tax=Segatella copri TaxID=165179 RepID=A0AAP3F770_9BACT|nr:alpha-L-fucosidase [Segatella copri]MCW4129580.1 alpha-L-fucosidase [Segatella copri]MCW4416283.1 alpha-L-fucosidase [Segatella copri]MCW4422797.1 alpha-L-fucosidase [Segatella copri]
MKQFKLMMLGLALSAGFTTQMQAQEAQSFVHQQSNTEDYVWPTDPQVLTKLKHWQDQKFGVLMHWGLYSVPGIVESWSICSEDWIVRERKPTYEEDKAWYWSQKDSLNPVNFDPGKWADVMKKAGMKYMIFTTKHHDGFCMFDTKYTDFSIAHGPFGKDPRHNIAKEVFNAYRNKGFMIGCYFSKPDWHSKWFWNPYYATPNRRINYKKKKHPDWWQNYRKFTQNQLNELTTDYGNIDILWLDGGWITGDEIGLDTILVDARKRNPGMISVDRTIRGKNENYQTPEQGIPAKQLDIPWESCITLSHAWGWTPNAKFKSPNKVIGILSEIVAKGGCLALGVGPKADGTLQPEVVKNLLQIGNWLNKNGQAIYSTVNAAHYNDGKVWFTADKNGKTLYAIYALEDGEKTPKTITWTENKPKGKLILLQNGKSVKYTVKGNQVTVTLPSGLKNEPLAFKFNSK